MIKRHRIFIAIDPPGEVKKRLSRYQDKWSDVPAKWVERENLHITLLFLGDITPQDLAKVCKVVGEVSKNHEGFNVSLSKVAYGPEGKLPPRYIWAGGVRVPELSGLKKDLENALFEAIKLKLDKGAFTPHITLARIKEWQWRAIDPKERPEVGEDIELTFTVESIEVMESQRTRQGPRYEVIESHQLQ